jgi:hypothetical protein
MTMVYTFVKGSLETVVWDPEKGKPLAEFVNGFFKTKNKEVAQKLTKLGYRDISDYPDGPPDGGFPPQIPDTPPLDTSDPTVDVQPPKTEAQALLKTAIAADADKAAAEADGENDEDDEDGEKDLLDTDI